MIIEFHAEGLEQAMAALPGRIDARAREGLDLTCEAIAARARQTTTYTDRSGMLRASTQNAGVRQEGDDLVGVVSFAARSDRGHLYGLDQEFGNRRGVREKRFIRDAIEEQDGRLLEGSLAAAFKDAGFNVVGG